MNTTFTISLPPALRQWVEAQIQSGGYGTPSEYVRELLRNEQKRQARMAVEAKLDEAITSGPAVPVTDATWQESEKRVAAVTKTLLRKNAKDR